ncbi:unnamed protein product [Brachionus calyciflorus]|uniref:Uncharacterized protein n=1 Tax=Brachionus calyciflorus TaxID=104777 RepID=A0A814EAA8_9BILA|nr:unnamed protein product [Brachionus calyciflorus]
MEKKIKDKETITDIFNSILLLNFKSIQDEYYYIRSYLMKHFDQNIIRSLYNLIKQFEPITRNNSIELNRFLMKEAIYQLIPNRYFELVPLVNHLINLENKIL